MTIETLSFVLLQIACSMNSLDQTNHGPSTIGVEWVIVWGLHAGKSIFTIFDWVVTNRWFDIISEISQESNSVIKLNSHCLIIDSTPGTLNGFTSLLCSCYISICQFHSPDIFLWELELVIFRYDLYVIWSFMSTNFICLKQINGINLLWNMEVPCTKNIVFQTMNWLIC